LHNFNLCIHLSGGNQGKKHKILLQIFQVAFVFPASQYRIRENFSGTIKLSPAAFPSIIFLG